MSTGSDSIRVETIKRRLLRKKAWQANYLDECVDSTLRIMGNELSNKGPRAQVKFLLAHGWSVKEIVREGRRVKKWIVKQVVYSLKNKKPKKKKRGHASAN